jgi:hypothetical protein
MMPCSCYLWSGTATTKTATDAFTACQSAGGALAVYPSYDMQKAVEEHFVAKGQWTYDDDMWWVAVARGWSLLYQAAPTCSVCAHQLW